MELNTKKQIDAINKQENSLKALREQAKARCPHTKRGDLDIVPAHNRKPGDLTYVCRCCQKDLDLKKISEQDLRDACDTIDRAIDVIKISLNLESDDDRQKLKRLSKVQFRVRNELVRSYGEALKGKNKGRRGNRGKGGNGGSAWQRPMSH